MQGATSDPVRPSGSVDQMLRGAVQTQLSLTQMADVKAHIILTVTSILVTVTLPYHSQPGLRLPVLLLDGFGLAAILFAVLAVRPRATPPRPGADPASAAFNVFFFGHFLSLGPEAYEDEILRIAAREGEPYRRIARSLYGMGQVLKRKYLYLRLAYAAFIAGLALAVLPLLLRGPLVP